MCDDNMPIASTTVLRKARKAHKCCECCRIIGTGERYEYCSGIWDDGPMSFKTCLHCAQVKEYVLQANDCYTIGQVDDDLINDGTMTAARMLVGMRRKWKAFKGDGLMKVIAI